KVRALQNGMRETDFINGGEFFRREQIVSGGQIGQRNITDDLDQDGCRFVVRAEIGRRVQILRHAELVASETGDRGERRKFENDIDALGEVFNRWLNQTREIVVHGVKGSIHRPRGGSAKV